MNEYNKYVGQVFTPMWAVNDVLDKVGYSCGVVITAKILEPAAGNGNFVLEIIRRIIKQAKTEMDNLEVLELIKNNVYAIEIDHDNFKNMIKNIQYLIKDELDLEVSKDDLPNIKPTDTLRWEHRIKFDFIVGNPPYTPVKFLPKKTKEYTLGKFKTVSHTEADVYGPFFEIAIDHISKEGTIGFIIPTTMFVEDKDKELMSYIGKYERFDYDENVFTAEIKTSLIKI